MTAVTTYSSELQTEKGINSSRLRLNVYNSITEIDKALWDTAASDIFNSWDFLYCLELSHIEDSRMKYLMFLDGGNPAGIAVLSSFSISLDLLSGPVVAKVNNIIRKFIPGFMRVKFLFCGTPISIGKNNLKITNEARKEKIFEMLIDEMTSTAKMEKINILSLKEFYIDECESLESLSKKGFIKAVSIPYVKLNIRGEWNNFSDYLSTMRYNYRRQVNKSLKKLRVDSSSLFSGGKDNTPRLVLQFPGKMDSAEFYKLYLEVMKRAKNKMEILNQEFFANTFYRLGGHCYLISLLHKGKVLGSAQIIIHDNVMTFLLIGLDYSKNRKYDIYFNIVYGIISLAIEKRCKVLEMGQTSYYLKQRCGGHCEEMYFYIKSLKKPVNFLLSIFHPLLFPKTRIKKLHVFHS